MEEKITAWVARDDVCDKLVLHLHKPYFKEEGMWKSSFIPRVLEQDLFPDIKWEDEEPTEVELTIKIL
jgi:hypothetical protein